MLGGRHRTTAVLLSGGWDSALCAVVAKKNEPRPPICVFFEYGQPYLAPERVASDAIAKALGLERRVIELFPLGSKGGVFDDRNRRLIVEAIKETDAEAVYFGCRNPFAWFDKFGDSNKQWSRKLERELLIEIPTPCVLMPKFLIKRQVRLAGVPDSMVYSTETV